MRGEKNKTIGFGGGTRKRARRGGEKMPGKKGEEQEDERGYWADEVKRKEGFGQ